MALSVEQFVENLVAIGLMSADEAQDALAGLSQPPADGEAFAKSLVRSGRLTYIPDDVEQILISRTVGQNRIVDEFILRCTHTIQIEWLLPGVPPTGRRLELAVVVIISFEDGKMRSEHIDWDLGSALAQVGLIDPDKLPVVGAEGARKVLNPAAVPSNVLLKRTIRDDLLGMLRNRSHADTHFIFIRGETAMTRRQIALLGFSLIGGGMIALTLNLGQIAAAEFNAREGADPHVQAVKKVHEKFYAALNAMFKGDPKPFADVWWHTDDIVYMGADGAYNVGWEQTYANWKKQAALKIGGKVEPSNVRFTVGKEIATANQYATGINYFDGKPREIKLRATSVFRQKDGVWKMICHHVDVIPPLGNILKDGK